MALELPTNRCWWTGDATVQVVATSRRGECDTSVTPWAWYSDLAMTGRRANEPLASVKPPHRKSSVVFETWTCAPAIGTPFCHWTETSR